MYLHVVRQNLRPRSIYILQHRSFQSFLLVFGRRVFVVQPFVGLWIITCTVSNIRAEKRFLYSELSWICLFCCSWIHYGNYYFVTFKNQCVCYPCVALRFYYLLFPFPFLYIKNTPHITCIYFINITIKIKFGSFEVYIFVDMIIKNDTIRYKL